MQQKHCSSAAKQAEGQNRASDCTALVCESGCQVNLWPLSIERAEKVVSTRR